MSPSFRLLISTDWFYGKLHTLLLDSGNFLSLLVKVLGIKFSHIWPFYIPYARAEKPFSAALDKLEVIALKQNKFSKINFIIL